jgi:hypothetical protein
MTLVEGLDPKTEWQECRTTIGRLDGTIADLQKFGFSLVTALITANALFTTGPAPGRNWAVPIAIDVLVTALFFVDRYYLLLLNAAVRRALVIEASQISAKDASAPDHSGDRLTQKMSLYAKMSGTVFIFPLLYVALLAGNWLMGFVLTSGHSAELRWAFVACVSAIAIYFFYTERVLRTGGFALRRTPRV